MHEAAGTNTVVDLAFGRTDDFFDGCEVVVTQDVVNQRVAAVPLEVRSAAAAWIDGRLVQWSSTQNAHGTRGTLASAYGLDDRPGARDHPRRGRRVRRQDGRLPRGGAARLAEPAGRPAGAVDRDPQREHGRPRPRARPAPDDRDRRPARRHRGGVPPHRAPGVRRLRRVRSDPPVPHPDDGAGHLRDPEGGVQQQGRHHQHHAHHRLPRGRAGPRPPPPSSAPWTSSPPRSAWTPPRCGARTSSRATRSRSPASPTPPTTSATTSAPSTSPSTRPATRTCAPSRPGAARPARPCSSASACRSTSRSPPGPRRARSSPRSRCTTTGRPPSTRAARRTGRATSPPSPPSPATSSASRWSASTWCGATPTSWSAARARWARARSSSAAPPCTRRRWASSSGRARWPPTPSRPTPTTSCSTRPTVASTWPARRPSGAPGPSCRWRRATTATRWRWSPTSRRRRPPSPSAATWRWSTSTPRPAASSWCATSRSTTPAASSTRCSPTGSATAASPRAPPRRSSRRSATTRTATPSPRTWPTTPRSPPPSCPSFELVAMETPTDVNPLGVKGIGEAGTIGVHARGAVGGGRRAVAPRRAPRRHAGQPRASVAGGAGGHRVTPTDRGRGPGAPLR